MTSHAYTEFKLGWGRGKAMVSGAANVLFVVLTYFMVGWCRLTL